MLCFCQAYFEMYCQMYKAFISGGGESSQHFKRCIDMNLRTRGMNYSIVLVSVIVYLTCVEEMCSRFRQSELVFVVLCVCFLYVQKLVWEFIYILFPCAH